MPNSTSLLAYNDVKEILDRAIPAKRGLQLEFKSTKEAIRWVSRANSFRVADRKNNATLYEPGHSLHKASVYDVLLIARENNRVSILTRSMEGVSVVEL